MEKLAVYNTRDVIEKYVPAGSAELPQYAAASAELTAAAAVDPNEGEVSMGPWTRSLAEPIRVRSP